MNSLTTWSLLTILLLHCASSQSVRISPMDNRTFLVGMVDNFQVTCTVPRGTNNVQWYRNGDLIDENDRITNTTIGRLSRLTVRNIKQYDSGYYQCEINNNRRSSFSGYVNVITIQITAPSPQQLIYHTNGTIQCSSLNDTFSLWHTVDPEATIMPNGTYNISDEGLNITNVQLYHQQQYKCEHALASSPHLVSSVIIDVEVLVPSMVTSSPTNISVVKGRTFSISFNYLAIPAPNFTWYINNNLHTEVVSTSEATDTHTMTFSNANKEGWYRCEVQNEHGTAEYRIFVDILIPPEITSIDNTVVAVGGDTSLSCTSNGDAPISYQWTHSGRTLSNGARISGANTNTLIITNLIEADNGTYTCITTNDHGSDSADASVIVVGLPKEPGSVNINGQSTTAVVTWTIATNTLNHPVDYVFVSYRISGSSDVMSTRVPANTSQLTLQDLIPDTPYIVDIIPNNMAGNYTSTRSHHFTTTVGAPMIETILCASDSYTSIQLAIILKYTGGSPIIEFLIRHRIASTTGWSSLVMVSNHSNAETPWNYSLTGLSFDQRGYEVEVTAMNSVGPSNAISSSPAPIMLLTDLPGRPRIWEPSSSSITGNSTTITCRVFDVGQPPLNRISLIMISPMERLNFTTVSSYSAGANVSIVANDLSSDTEYVFACYASSVVGNGEQSRQIRVRTDKPSSTANDASSDGTQNMGIYIGVTTGIILMVLLLIAILLLYFCCVRKSSHQNSYFVKGPLSAEENQFQISPGVMRRQFNFEQPGAAGSSITRHQVSDSVSSKQEGLPGNRFSNPMSSAQEGLSSIRYSNTVTSNQGGLSSLQFSSQPSPISNGNYVPLSQQVSNGISSSCATRQLSNPTSNLNLQPGCSGSTATYPLSMDRITAHYHISGSLTSSSLYDDDDSKLSYPPSTFATVV